MRLHRVLRSAVGALNLLIAVGALLSTALLGVGVGLLMALAQPCSTVWALVQDRPSSASTITACAINGLTLSIGSLIAILSTALSAGKHDGDKIFISFLWVFSVALPIINLVAVVLWHRTTRPDNSSEPIPLRESA